MSGEKLFELAEEGLLDKSLSDEQLERYGLTEAHKKQEGIINNALEKVGKYTRELPDGERIVFASEQIAAGSSIAYETGINYYVSVSSHTNKEKEIDGVTFAITSKPGIKLPETVLRYGKKLEDKYRVSEDFSNVYVNPNGQMIVAGGFKNPEFKIEGKSVQSMIEEIQSAFKGDEIEIESMR